MSKLLMLVGQVIVYGGIAMWLGYFANSPVYTHLSPDKALIKLSIVHTAQRKGECRRRTAEELAAMPPNMRTPLDCPRERLPVLIEILLDGESIYRESLVAAGLAHGGKTRAYARFPVSAGEHMLVARMVDSARSVGYDYEHSARITLSPRENFVIDFRAETGGFRFVEPPDDA